MDSANKVEKTTGKNFIVQEVQACQVIVSGSVGYCLANILNKKTNGNSKIHLCIPGVIICGGLSYMYHSKINNWRKRAINSILGEKDSFNRRSFVSASKNTFFLISGLMCASYILMPNGLRKEIYPKGFIDAVYAWGKIYGGFQVFYIATLFMGD